MADPARRARLRLWAFRALAWALVLAPLALLLPRLASGRLTANPIEFLEHWTGLWSLRLLLVTLAITPLRALSGWPEPLRLRRTLGLAAYGWLCVHFAIYLGFDLDVLDPALAARQLGEDLAKRAYITAGFAAWLLLLPLAITSTDAWQRRLGRRWKTLHRAIYPAVALGALHFLWLVKKDLREPLVYAAILALLLLLRLPALHGRLLRLRAQPA